MGNFSAVSLKKLQQSLSGNEQFLIHYNLSGFVQYLFTSPGS